MHNISEFEVTFSVLFGVIGEFVSIGEETDRPLNHGLSTGVRANELDKRKQIDVKRPFRVNSLQ